MEHNSDSSISSTHTSFVDALGTWCREFSWSWFATFSFRKPTTVWGAQRTFEVYLARLSDLAQSAVSSIYTVERGPLGSQFHIHALVGNVGLLPPRCGSATSRGCVGGCGTHQWKSGFADVRAYDAEQPGAFYVLKHCGRSSEMQIFGVPQRVMPEVMLGGN